MTSTLLSQPPQNTVSDLAQSLGSRKLVESIRKKLATQDNPLISRSVTVVIPCLNEEGNLVELLRRFQNAFDRLGFELPGLVVDDGSTDQTPEILAQLSEQYVFLQVTRHSQCRGVAAVWQTALDLVTTDWIFWGQADLESDPETDLEALLNGYER